MGILAQNVGIVDLQQIPTMLANKDEYGIVANYLQLLGCDLLLIGYFGSSLLMPPSRSASRSNVRFKALLTVNIVYEKLLAIEVVKENGTVGGSIG